MWSQVLRLTNKGKCRFKSCHSKVVRSLRNRQALSVLPAEIIKMLALVGLQKASKRCNDVP